MATSGSTDFTLNRDEIIARAYRMCDIIGDAETPSANQVTEASYWFNLMLKSWQSEGLKFHLRKEATLYLTSGTYSYNLNSSSGDNLAYTSDVVETTLSAAEAAAQTTLSVTTSTGMAGSDVVLIQLDDGTLHSTTISSVDDSTTITVASGLASAAASGNVVYAYTTKLDRPREILDARLYTSDGNERPMQKISHEEYYRIPDKDQAGEPFRFYYEPDVGTGKLHLWPAPDDVTDRIRLTIKEQLEDVDSATDNIDFPQDALEAVILGLAQRLALINSIPDNKYAKLTLAAQSAKRRMERADSDELGAQFVPDVGYYE